MAKEISNNDSMPDSETGILNQHMNRMLLHDCGVGSDVHGAGKKTGKVCAVKEAA